MDRITPLPQTVQIHILDFLDEKEIGRAAVLSKAWRSIVQTRLVFDQPIFRRKRGSDKLTKVGMIISEDLCFMNHVDGLVQKVVRQDPSVQKFSLVTDLYDTKSWSHYLDRWIQQVVEAKVKVLILNLKQAGPPPYAYVLPPFVFLSETITNLRLDHIDLGQCNHMSMPNLLELSLRYVTLSQDMIDQISSGCPNLEILRLLWCRGFSSIRVSGLARLHEVELNLAYESQTDIKVVAPMLQVFKVRSNPYSKIDLLACESTLRVLSLSRVNVTAEGLRDLVSRFLGLEELVLSYLGVESIEIPNQNFLKLEVSHCSSLRRRVRIDAPNLRVLKYYENNLSFDPVISSISPNCAIEVYADFNMMINKSDIKSYKNLFLKLIGLPDIKLIVSDFERDVIVCQMLDENIIEKIYESRITRVRSVEVVRIATHERIVDHLFDSRLFGSLRKKTKVCIVSHDEQSNGKFLEVISKEKLKEKKEEPNCCRYKSPKCWRYSLYDADMIDEETIQFTSRSLFLRSVIAGGYKIARMELHLTSDF